MHTVELLAFALEAAQRLGYRIRQEWLGGNGGGACQLKGRKLLFLDLGQGPSDQLQCVVEALRAEPDTVRLPLPHELRTLLDVRKIA